MAAPDESNDGLISNINVTPLVDITLVLLIVFMVTAKIIVSQSVPLDLPRAASSESVQLVLGVEVDDRGQLRVNGKAVSDERAILKLAREALQNDDRVRAVIRADHRVQHGRIIRVLDLLKQAGVTRIAFAVTPVPPEDSADPEQPGETVLTEGRPVRPAAATQPSTPKTDLGS